MDSMAMRFTTITPSGAVMPARLRREATLFDPLTRDQLSRLNSERARANKCDTRCVLAGSALLLFAGTSLALLAVPGPAVIYVTRSLEQPRAAGMVSMLGVETGHVRTTR
jgi:hypothetical protein